MKMRAGVWCLWVMLVAVAAACHEHSFDEAQGWMLGRDAHWWQLVTLYSHYEGHPGGWYGLLWLLNRVGLPYSAFWLAGAVPAAVGAAVWLRRSPVPAVLRYLAPFSFFFLYQYAAVARPYCILPALIFGCAAFYDDRGRGRYAFTACLAVMFQLTVHGFLIGAGIYLARIRRLVTPLSLDERRRETVCFGILLASAGVMAAQLLPFPLDTMVPGTRSLETLPAWLHWAAVEGFADSLLPSLVVLAVSCFWFALRGVLLDFFLPSFFLMALFALLHARLTHVGLLSVVWLYALWLSFREPVAEKHKRAAQLVTAVAGALLVYQAAQGITACWREVQQAASPAPAAAAFVREQGWDKGQLYAANYEIWAMQPYFSQNIFDNWHNKDASAALALRWEEPLMAENYRNPPAQVLHDRPLHALYLYDFGRRMPTPGYRTVAQFTSVTPFKFAGLHGQTIDALERIGPAGAAEPAPPEHHH